MSEDTQDTKSTDTKATEDVKKEAVEKHEDDSIKWRSKYKVTKEELETFKARTESEKNELSQKVDTTSKERQMFEQKYVEAELKAHAVAAGIKDLEFVKLIDKAEIKLDDKGNLVGVEKAIADAKTRKPDWFGVEKKTSSSTNATFSEQETKKLLDGRTMSSEDWKKNKSRLMAGQF